MSTLSSWKRITAAQVHPLCQRDELIIFDVRDAASYQQGHMKQARHLAEANLEFALFKTPKSSPLLIYCYHGNASQSYAKIFADFGFKEIYDLIDGYEAWRIFAATSQNQLATTLPESIKAWLISHDFNSKNINGTIANQTTPLMCASRLGETAMVKAFLELGADLNAVNSDGNNALWLACFNGNLDIIDILVKNGISIDHQNDNGSTCLMYAASASKPEVVERLLALGANSQLKNLDDFTALDMAASLECLNLLRPQPISSDKQRV